MANALVVRPNQLPRSQLVLRAAQYVRMSTDYQRYSIENQVVVIAAYAERHGLTIVRTYRDEGESGLRIRNRKGLRELIDDVSSGRADFTHLLVYDVSRWGRFQDTDEAAHKGADQLSIVSTEIAVELGNLDKLGGRIGHRVLLTNCQGIHNH